MDPLVSYCSFRKRISRYKNLVKCYEKYLSYLTRFFERKFLTMFPKLKPKNPLKRIRCLRNKEFEIYANFRRQIPLCITVVFVKES